MLNYNNTDNRALTMRQRADFKNQSETNAVSIFPQPDPLRLEVAPQVIAQPPEFMQLVQSPLANYKGLLSEVISSDDESLKQVYTLMGKDMDDEALSRQQFFELADKVRSDISKCLDNPNNTPAESKEYLDMEMKVLRMVDAKDTEKSANKKEIGQRMDNKDSEKRQFNQIINKHASKVLCFLVGAGLVIAGGGKK